MQSPRLRKTLGNVTIAPRLYWVIGKKGVSG
jgi:hypothetical protein